MGKLKVLVAAADELVRQDARAILRSEPKIRVVGEAATGAQTIQQTKRLKPNLVIMDLTMPQLDGVEIIRKIQAADPETRVIILGTSDSEALARRIINDGAHGYLLKADLGKKLRSAVKAVSPGIRYFSRQAPLAIAEPYVRKITRSKSIPPVRLTQREYEVAQLLSVGKSSKEISAVLKITVRTVETHRANMMRKLNVHSVTELLHRAFKAKLIDPNDERILKPRANNPSRPQRVGQRVPRMGLPNSDWV